MRKALCLLSLTTCCFLNSGCITVGPKIETQVVIVRAGNPVKIIENRALKCQTLTGGNAVKQDVGGWVAMPEEHWLAVKRKLEESK